VDEREYERNLNAWHLGDATSVKNLPAPNQSSVDNDDYIPAPDYLDVIDEVLDTH
jgi:hypothetical protein